MTLPPFDSAVDDEVLERAVVRARELISAANAQPTRAERRTRRRLRRLFDDPAAVNVTITLSDEVMRFPSVAPAARALRRAVRDATSRGFGPVNVVGLRLVATLSRLRARWAVSLVSRRVRGLTSDLILDADAQRLTPVMVSHRAAGLALNVNVLGEAVLGEREAADRLARVLEMMRRPDVDYVSVKLSSVVSQLLTVDHEGSLERVTARLRTLYDAALAEGTFVNLDMEEFRDLRLTLDAFTTVLGEARFLGLSAGVVLQAYLPESHDALQRLQRWASERRERGGAPIKVRLVKGANLAMELVEAELHGWSPAPYPTKAAVDESYCALVDRALDPTYRDVVRVGVASHNLFHVAWALELARVREVSDQLDVEMLEGMANAEAAALVASGTPVLLYAPVTRRDDFAAAVAYLVRRLDENTAPENYLRAALFIADDPQIFDEQRQRFVDAVRGRHDVGRETRRGAGRTLGEQFSNEPDGDPTDRDYVNALTRALESIRADDDVTLRETYVVANGSHELDDSEVGHDPSDHGRPWYRYHVATAPEVDRAVARARQALTRWSGDGAQVRASTLRVAADLMASERAQTIAVMARDGGKTVGEADPEVSEAIDFARYYGERAPLARDATPLGVVLVVPPWNFPYAIPAGGVCAALAAGNTVLLKPAPESVAVAATLVRQLWAAGVSRDALQLVATRDDDVGRHLVTHEGVDAVILTGSFDTAALFTSWKPTLRLLAETSGKNAIVVTASADVDLAVKDLVHSAFGHAGQKCSAASLAIVERALFDDPLFLAQLEDAVTTLTVGAAYELASDVGPIIRPPEEALRRALTTLDEGETWLVEPRALDGAGLLWRPGVKLHVRPGSWSHLHEWFGPVLGVMVADNLDEALAWQNETPYGLTGGLHSLDESECERWLEGVHVGNLYVNRGVTGAVVRRQPFGGWKRSSVGPTAKAGGAHYLECLCSWPEVDDVEGALELARAWWRLAGVASLDVSTLEGERNVARYRSTLRPPIVRVDDTTSAATLRYLRGLIDLASVDVEFSSATVVRGLFDVTLETTDELAERVVTGSRVRWLSSEEAPAVALLAGGANLDRRPLAQDGAVELPRWLLEQSVAVTNHRYGNVHAGPKPLILGLGQWSLRRP